MPICYLAIILFSAFIIKNIDSSETVYLERKQQLVSYKQSYSLKDNPNILSNSISHFDIIATPSAFPPKKVIQSYEKCIRLIYKYFKKHIHHQNSYQIKLYLYEASAYMHAKRYQETAYYDIDKKAIFINISKVDISNRDQVINILHQACMMIYLNQRKSLPIISDKTLSEKMYQTITQLLNNPLMSKQILFSPNYSEWKQQYVSNSDILTDISIVSNNHQIIPLKDISLLIEKGPN